MRLSLVLAAVIFISLCSGFDLSPINPNPGDSINLTGVASPGEQVSFRSSFSMKLPVSGGQYNYETKVEIPQTPNRFAIEVENVQDLNAGVKLGIWITKSFPANGGVASISHSNVPPGRYDLRMFGVATPGAVQVPVKVMAESAVKADSQGRYSMTIDTSGVPAGEYRIDGQGETKTIYLGGSSGNADTGESSKNSGTSSNHAEVEAKSRGMPRNVKITPEVIRWYAEYIGMNCSNESQYAQAERLLKTRISSGYWYVIAKGEPLTEAAGNCDQMYCLVRGTDACRECREKDMIQKGAQQPVIPRDDVVEAKAASQNVSDAVITKAPEGVGDWIGQIMDFLRWIEGILGVNPGGLRISEE